MFALLGHNGAGKTTIIKMVTAQANATAGDATIHGLSVTTDASKIRRFLGVCPQVRTGCSTHTPGSTPAADGFSTTPHPLPSLPRFLGVCPQHDIL